MVAEHLFYHGPWLHERYPLTHLVQKLSSLDKLVWLELGDPTV